MSDNCKQSITV